VLFDQAGLEEAGEDVAAAEEGCADLEEKGGHLEHLGGEAGGGGDGERDGEGAGARCGTG
jgi:hypothetical protein